MRIAAHFRSILDRQTLIITLLALAATWVCVRFQARANLPSGLIGVAIIFPIVFSINAAYRRREEALRYFASLKAHAVAIWYAHRDWVPGKEEATDHADRARGLILELLKVVAAYFKSDPDHRDHDLKRVYTVFSGFSRSSEALRSAGVPANEISRINQYLRAMMIEFERMRNIRRYRTPLTLRAYSAVFLNIFPILFAPYFAYLVHQYQAFAGYGVAVLYSVVLVSLDNIQEALENPFDAVGLDDIDLDVDHLYRPVLGEETDDNSFTASIEWSQAPDPPR